MTNIDKALQIAFEMHKGQKRKCNNSPYITHILDVASLLLAEPDATEEMVIAGILHDTLEDTGYTANQLKTDFGQAVLDLVLFATESHKDADTTIQEKKATWKSRKQHTLDACATATDQQLMIVLADKVANLRNIKDDLLIYGDTIWNHFNASHDDIMWYYSSLQKILNEKHGINRLLTLYNNLISEIFE